MAKRINREFFRRDVLEVAPELLGKRLIRIFRDGSQKSFIITETEAYRGQEDKACHASKGFTSRTEVMFREGGYVYMYLIYGMYWMLNIVAGPAGVPQAVLIRGIAEASGPGRLTRLLHLDRDFYGEDLVTSERIWLEEGVRTPEVETTPRIGIEYAGDPWKDLPWRFLIKI
jgi:DNA-3-methyladenine glycosylase